MPVIDDVSKSDLPAYLTREVKDIIITAATLGWTVHVASDGQSVAIWSYDERKKHHFNTRRSGRIHQVRRDLVKHARPDLKEKAERHIAGDRITAADMVDVPTIEEAIVVHDTPPQREPIPKHCQAWLEGVEHRRHKWYADEDKGQPLICEGYEDESSTGPTVISQRVMVAKGREGEGYDSPTTWEQTMSDGTKRYACRFPGCDYTAEGRGSVAAHWAKSKSHPEAGDSARYEAEVPDARKYAPRKTRIEALAEVIAKMLEQGATEPYDIARQALTWVHEQSGQGTDLAAEREPLTAEETLDRIRMLLDQGQHQTLIDENERLIQEHRVLQDKMVEAEVRADAAEEAARSIREQWSALVDLVGSIREEQKGA